jgi:hypothetical protein
MRHRGTLTMYSESVEILDCLAPIEALESIAAVFTRCWDCDEIINSDVFPVCDNCVILRGPFSEWCPCEAPKNCACQVSMCPWCEAYWGRWLSVFHRRALAA